VQNISYAITLESLVPNHELQSSKILPYCKGMARGLYPYMVDMGDTGEAVDGDVDVGVSITVVCVEIFGLTVLVTFVT
jgi:hypothetical protein